MAQGDGKKLKEQMKHDCKAQWNPSDAEKALFEQMTPAEKLKVAARGGADLNKLRRWYQETNGGDVYAFYHALQEWQAETNRALYG